MNDLLTPEDLAAALRLPVARVLVLRREESWPSLKFGRRYRFTREHFDQIIASHTVRAKKPDSAAIDSGLTSASRSRTKAAS